MNILKEAIKESFKNVFLEIFLRISFYFGVFIVAGGLKYFPEYTLFLLLSGGVLLDYFISNSIKKEKERQRLIRKQCIHGKNK